MWSWTNFTCISFSLSMLSFWIELIFCRCSLSFSHFSAFSSVSCLSLSINICSFCCSFRFIPANCKKLENLNQLKKCDFLTGWNFCKAYSTSSRSFVNSVTWSLATWSVAAAVSLEKKTQFAFDSSPQNCQPTIELHALYLVCEV